MRRTQFSIQMRTAGANGDYEGISKLLELGAEFKHAVRGAAEADNSKVLNKLLSLDPKLYHYALEGALVVGDIPRAARYYETMIENGWTLHGNPGFKDLVTHNTIAYYFQFSTDILRNDLPFHVPEDIRETHMAFRGKPITAQPMDLLLKAIHEETWSEVLDILKLNMGTCYVEAIASFIVRLPPSKCQDLLSCVNLLPPSVAHHMLTGILDHAMAVSNLELVRTLIHSGAQMRVAYPDCLEREVADILLINGYPLSRLMTELVKGSSLYAYYHRGKTPVPYVEGIRDLITNAC